MLESIGYRVFACADDLVGDLRSVGCDAAGNSDYLVKDWGYDPPLPYQRMATAEFSKPGVVDLYVDLKAQRSYKGIVARWPHLTGKVVWWRINGGEPEHVINARGDHGNEMTPPCPIVTPNRWYAAEYLRCSRCDGTGESGLPDEFGQRRCWECDGEGEKKTTWHNTPRYVVWPQLVGHYAGGLRQTKCGTCGGTGEIGPHTAQDGSQTKCHSCGGSGLYPSPREQAAGYSPPLCLVHNLSGWGYGPLVDAMKRLGVRMYGLGSPDGVLRHSEVGARLTSAIAYVHLKSNDAPGYALLEALSYGCPVVCTRKLIWKCKMQDLLVPNETCLVFDEETHAGFTADDLVVCEAEVKNALDVLQDKEFNRKIGNAGRERLKGIMWSSGKKSDVASFGEFMARNFPS